MRTANRRRASRDHRRLGGQFPRGRGALIAAGTAAAALCVVAPAASAQGSLQLLGPLFGSLGGPQQPTAPAVVNPETTTPTSPAVPSGTTAAPTAEPITEPGVVEGGTGTDPDQTEAKQQEAEPSTPRPAASADLISRAYAGVVTSGINQARADAGLPRLIAEPTLEDHAGRQAARMAAQGRASTVPAPDGATNFAWNAIGLPNRTTPDVVLRRFLADDSLRKVMLDPARTKVGTGFAVAADGQQYVVVDFTA